jgi:hypothetical protein
MKWIRLLMLVAFSSHFSFLFADGTGDIVKDTLPVDRTVKQLPTVVLRRQIPLGSTLGDTLIFDAQRYARPTAFRLEELLRNVPGFRVDGEGRIYFNGKEISRIMIDGDDLAGDRYRMLSGNLRSAMVDKLEVIQSYQPNRLLKDYTNTTSPAINIRLKNEYRGKLSGSLSVGLGLKKLKEHEAEMLWMRDKWKEMVFVDFNNNGRNMASGRTNETDGSGLPLLYEIHPFAFRFSDQQRLIPVGQLFRNENKSLTSMGNFNSGKNIKMNLALSGGKYDLQQDQVVKRTILQKDANPLLLLQQIKMVRNTNQFLIRAGWDKDHGKNRLVKSLLQLGYDDANHQHSEIRFGTNRYNLTISNREKQARMQWDREETRKLFSGIIMQMQTRLALGEVSTETLSSTAPATDSFGSLPINQHLYRKGFLFEEDLRFLGVGKNIKWKWGLRSSFENFSTTIEKNDFDYRMVKSFSYAEVNCALSKKLASVTQMAVGIVIHGDEWQYSHPVHLLEQKLQWKFRRLLQLQLSGGISKKSGNIRDLYAGSVLNREGILLSGYHQLNFPLSYHLRAGATQVDLYAGRSWSMLLHYLKNMNQMGQGLMISSGSEKWNPFLIGSRHTLTVDLQGEQYIMPLKSRIRLNLQFSGISSPQLFNGSTYHRLMRSLMLDVRIIQQSKGPVGCELYFQRFTADNQLVAMSSLAYKAQQKAIISKCWWRSGPSTNISVSYAMIKTKDIPAVHMIDLNLDAKIGKRMKCAIVGQNLLHQEMYTVISNDPFGITQTEQRLNGRRILFQFRYSF